MPKKGSRHLSHRNSSKNHNNVKEVPPAASSSSSPSSIVVSSSSNSLSERADIGSENAKRLHKSLHISSKNDKRWDSLKTLTGYTNDDDLFTHLLDLADSIAG